MKIAVFSPATLKVLGRITPILVGWVLTVFLLQAGEISADAQTPVKAAAMCSNANGLTNDEIDDIVKSHNAIRAALKLSPLVWDCKLADLAQDWAKHGVAAHRDDNDFGESIFVASSPAALAAGAVSHWQMERSFWDNKSALCTPGKTCTHYTQIVWKKTSRLGCGINRNVAGQWKTILVCNYDPAGNSAGRAY